MLEVVVVVVSGERERGREAFCSSSSLILFWLPFFFLNGRTAVLSI